MTRESRDPLSVLREGIDVLAVMDRYATVFQPNRGMDGEDMRQARLIVAELIAAASAGTPENGDRAVSPGLWFGPQRATRLRNALSLTESLT